MPILSSNPMWEAFGLRALPYALYGGADTGECVTTVNRVGVDGTPDDWYREWTATADRIAGIARESERRGHLVSQKALNDLDHADPAAFAPFEQFLCSPEADPMLRWRLIQRLFGVHGKSNLYDLVKDITRFEISSVPQNINCSHIAHRG
jgi:hypothetical protein